MPRTVEFEHTRRCYDRYKMFYTDHFHGAIVHFETGEIVLNRVQFKPFMRKLDTRYNLRFVMPHDNDAVLHRITTIDGEPVRKTWLYTDTLMLDYETQQVICPTFCRNPGDEHGVPNHITRHVFAAYCPGAGRKWVPYGNIGYTKPRKLDKEAKRHLKDLRTQCMTADKLGALPQNLWHVPMDQRGVFQDHVGYGRGGCVPIETALALSYTDMTPFERAVVSRCGFEPPRDEVSVRELRFNPE